MRFLPSSFNVGKKMINTIGRTKERKNEELNTTVKFPDVPRGDGLVMVL
jgi:hypothetical protein